MTEKFVMEKEITDALFSFFGKWYAWVRRVSPEKGNEFIEDFIAVLDMIDEDRGINVNQDTGEKR